MATCELTFDNNTDTITKLLQQFQMPFDCKTSDDRQVFRIQAQKDMSNWRR